MDAASLIRALGGARAVGAAIGVSRQAVHNALRRGALPAEWHLPLWRLALDEGLDWQPPRADGLRDRLCARPARPSSSSVVAPVSSSHPDTSTEGEPRCRP